MIAPKRGGVCIFTREFFLSHSKSLNHARLLECIVKSEIRSSCLEKLFVRCIILKWECFVAARCILKSEMLLLNFAIWRQIFLFFCGFWTIDKFEIDGGLVWLNLLQIMLDLIQSSLQIAKFVFEIRPFAVVSKVRRSDSLRSSRM